MRVVLLEDVGFGRFGRVVCRLARDKAGKSVWQEVATITTLNGDKLINSGIYMY